MVIFVNEVAGLFKVRVGENEKFWRKLKSNSSFGMHAPSWPVV